MGSTTGMSVLRLATTTLLTFVMASSAFETLYCSSQNTGSTDMFFWTWQTNGKCTDHCNALGTYAYAVIKYTDCWCSNYAPSQQTDNSECEVECPGYKTENCGDKDKDLFVYIKMNGSPSGTQGNPQPTTADTEPSSTTMRTLPATSSSVTTTMEPVTTPVVMTESGVVVTRTLVVTPTPIPGAASSDNGGGGGSNTGVIVGGAVGGVAGLLAIVGGILFLLWRRRRQHQENGQGGASGITRNTSTMSRHGLLGGAREKNEPQQPPPIVTNMGSQRSRTDESLSPMTGSERRYSQPVLVDSRLNPRAVLTFHGSNESRDSLASIDDSRDYGRQLNVVNPDPHNRD